MGGLKIFGMKPLPIATRTGFTSDQMSLGDPPDVNSQMAVAAFLLRRQNSLRQATRSRRYSIRTEDTYFDCARRLSMEGVMAASRPARSAWLKAGRSFNA